MDCLHVHESSTTKTLVVLQYIFCLIDFKSVAVLEPAGLKIHNIYIFTFLSELWNENSIFPKMKSNIT